MFTTLLLACAAHQQPSPPAPPSAPGQSPEQQSYTLAVQKAVNPQWQAALDDLSSELDLEQDIYTTRVAPTLSADGTLHDLALVERSASVELDEALVAAFHRSELPPVPPGLLHEGHYTLPPLTFTVHMAPRHDTYYRRPASEP